MPKLIPFVYQIRLQDISIYLSILSILQSTFLNDNYENKQDAFPRNTSEIVRLFHKHFGTLHHNLIVMIKPVLIVFGCLAAGNVIVAATGLPLPASIVGMILLTILFITKLVKVEEVKSLGDFFNSHMSFFFVPAGVSVMLYLDIIRGQFLPIVVSAFVSTILVIVATGWTHQLMRSKNKKK